MNLTDLTLTQALEKLKSREITATQLANAYLDRIKEINPQLNCYITVTRERALADAAASDARYAVGTPLPLDGIPIGVKDLFATRGILTTAASKILENFVPEYESSVSQKLIDAGTVLLGKLNMDEFAMGSTGRSSYFGPAINPWQRNRKLTPGGSSSGSSCATMGGLAVAATGTDTGCSVRTPAAWTGGVAMKTSYGLCSRFGCIAYASSFDCPGPVTRTTDDCALMLSVMAGHDPRDSTSSPLADEVAASLRTPLAELSPSGLKIGVVKELNEVEISEDMKRLQNERLEQLKSGGAEIVEISIPSILDALVAYYIITPAEASSNLARYDGMRYGLSIPGANLDDTYMKTRAAGFGTEVQRRMIIGTAVLSSESYEVYYLKAARVRRLVADGFARAFEQCDMIICPVTAGTAFELSAQMSALDDYALDIFTTPVNLAGLPACSVPAGLAANGLPLGLQVIGQRFDDLRVLQLGKTIEKLTNLDNRPSTIEKT